MKSSCSIHQPSSEHILRKSQLQEKLASYGFNEIADILNFLDSLCSSYLCDSEYMYISGEIRLCLQKHDNGSDYFIPLRELACELDFLTHWAAWK